MAKNWIQYSSQFQFQLLVTYRLNPYFQSASGIRHFLLSIIEKEAESRLWTLPYHEMQLPILIQLKIVTDRDGQLLTIAKEVNNMSVDIKEHFAYE